ncbi:hypothetical protein UFOVP1454_5 [uncultured Caudovirales phage]|uniref:Collagen triple helix repeat n=1 Tax=uncultured Caudovirales phage TaxID=2100421 RepID=A0A6J5SHM4_9CAUD|nr:hypothetical protein UFOVP1454_5 [uncultured Caudovirales phage]
MKGTNKDTKASLAIARKINLLEGKVKDIEDALVETIVDTINAVKPKDGESIKGDKGDKGDKGAKGDKGEDGKSVKGKDGIDGRDGINGISIKGDKGSDGVGFEEAKINESGELIITRSDKKEINVGVVKGKDGETSIRTVYTTGGGGSDRPYIQQQIAIVQAQIAASAVTLSGENYLSLTGQTLTANAVTLSGTNVTGTLPESKGGTNQSTYTLGDTLYSSATNTLAKLNGNITTTKKFYTQTGTGTISDTPAWSTVSDTDVNFTNNSTGNASTAAHGYLPILPGNTTTFLRADGAFVAPSTSAIPSGTFQQGFAAVTSVVVTHNLGSYPHVQLIDNSLAVFIPLTITNNSVNQLTITFSASTTGTVLLTSGSPPLQAYSIVSADYSVVSTDVYIECDASGKTITMPSATVAANQNKFFNIDNSSAGNITIATTSSQTIQGSLTQTLPTQSNYTLVSNGTNWRIK